MEKEKWDRIKNYKLNSINLNSLENEIQNHFQNIILNPNIKLLKIFYEYLHTKNNLLGIEYRCLCWLDMIYNFPTNLNKPFLNEPVYMELGDFKNKYMITNKRTELLNILIDFISDKKKQSNLDYMTVLIGGSFTDLDIKLPNDIDLVIIKPNNLEQYNTDFNATYLYASNSIPKGLDIEFLPESLDKSSFKIFSRIIALGNNAEIKEKSKLHINSNSFKLRKIVELKI
ncbi:DUF6932 family protein [Lacinutrix mariniflava]|uniref:DUF6932 family protein n=1 Tax=Lacinutrix mariniflava TaxID=342955 RepID=UPI0006E4694C|nr:hypothetical protein [Lacinutrix mariniflava]